MPRVAKYAAWFGALRALWGCGWDHLDAIGPAPGAGVGQTPDAAQDAPSTEDAVTPEAAASAEAAGDDDVGDVSAAEAAMSLDSTLADGAGPTDAPPTDSASSSSLPCSGSPSVVRQWPFDADTQAWTLSMNPGVQGWLAWNGSMGNPAPGALEANVMPNSSDSGADKTAWVRYNGPIGDLSGRTLSAWVWLDKGPSTQLKLFVLTSNQYVWADNGIVTPSLGTWTCLSMPISSPAYVNGPAYDPTSVVAVGIEARNAAPFRLFVDTVRYY